MRRGRSTTWCAPPSQTIRIEDQNRGLSEQFDHTPHEEQEEEAGGEDRCHPFLTGMGHGLG